MKLRVRCTKAVSISSGPKRVWQHDLEDAGGYPRDEVPVRLFGTYFAIVSDEALEVGKDYVLTLELAAVQGADLMVRVPADFARPHEADSE